MPRTDLLVYSFPCQDLSTGGLGRGMRKGSGTRSGLLWEIERILKELKELNRLPKYLLLENVKTIKADANIDDLNQWLEFLSSIGYQNSQCLILNALDYGVPQDRERAFIISCREKRSMKKIEEKILAAKKPRVFNISDFIKNDYSNPTYKAEADKAQLNKTPSRDVMWRINQKAINNDIQVRLTCRAMVFANGVPKSLYDKTAGWKRRLIILSAKSVPRGRVNDPNLSDKLAEETEGMFLWAFEGLKRLIAQGFKFTLSDHARRNIEDMKEDNCSIVGFLADKQFVCYGSELECSTADLYYGYCQWCRLNSVTFIRRESFNTWMKQNADRYGLIYERYVTSIGSSKKARGYRGITCLYRACAD